MKLCRDEMMADESERLISATRHAEADVFADEEVVAAYAHRLPYGQEVYDTLLGLIADNPRTVLDAGCGLGDIARGLAQHVDRVDAVDPSAVMVRAGKASAGGVHPNLEWVCATMEEAPLSPPYALVVAGSSLHWMDWQVVFPRFAEALAEHGLLALVSGGIPSSGEPWLEEEWALLAEYNPRLGERLPKPYLQVLAENGWFTVLGQLNTQQTTHRQSVEDYIGACHSRGIYACRIGADRVAEFDSRLRTVLERYSDGGFLQVGLTETITWGRPHVRLTEDREHNQVHPPNPDSAAAASGQAMVTLCAVKDITDE